MVRQKRGKPLRSEEMRSRLIRLATVRKLALPALQVNIGQNQFNLACSEVAMEREAERPDPKRANPPRTAEVLADTAAVIKILDMVVTVDTSVCDLSGALGVPIWIVLPYIACWRWLLGREDSPWHPSARLLRQTSRGDWEGVFERIAGAVRERMVTTSQVRYAV